MKVVFKLPEVRSILGLSAPTLRKIIASGEIRTIKVGAREMVSRDELERFAALRIFEPGDSTAEAAGALENLEAA